MDEDPPVSAISHSPSPTGAKDLSRPVAGSRALIWYCSDSQHVISVSRGPQIMTKNDLKGGPRHVKLCRCDGQIYGVLDHCCSACFRIAKSGMSASSQCAKLQAWTIDAERILHENVQPIAKHVELRTEFSGACTAELALQAVAALCGDKMKVECSSIGDWSNAARYMAELNFSDTCRFKDIMDIADEKLQHALTEEVTVKAGCFCCRPVECLCCFIKTIVG